MVLSETKALRDPQNLRAEPECSDDVDRRGGRGPNLKDRRDA